MRFVLPLAIVVYLDILNPKLRERFCRFCEFRIKVMVSFLISSAIGFTIYQLAAWALLSEDRLFFRVGNSVINLAPEAATWLRRLLVVLLVGVGLTLVIWLHRPFAFPDDALGGAVILGFFYGPLLAIWINTLLAKPSKESPSIGQYVAGAGLALLFLVGSVGDQMGALILGYARQISKISFGGAELSFTQKSSEASTLGGPLSLSGNPPTYASSSGAIGLDYLGSLASMIERDIEYLKLFKKIELPEVQSKRSISGAVNKSQEEIVERTQKIDGVLAVLGVAKSFAANTIEKPSACLVGWYSKTGDAESINRHIAGFANIFKRLPTIESGEPVDQLAEEFIKRSFLIAADAIASVPSYILADKCDDILEQFCPEAFTYTTQEKLDDLGHKSSRKQRERDKDSQKLTGCLRVLQSAIRRNEQIPIFDKLQGDIQPYLSGFVASRGWEARPYYALGYASILSQLGQDLAASALLDSWIQTRIQRPTPVWDTAAEWFDVRARSILVNFLEIWLKKEGSSAPTAVRNEHIANLDSLRTDLKGYLSRVDFFRAMSGTIASPPPGRSEERFKLEDKLRSPASCSSRDQDIVSWRRLFETYVTAELSYLNAIMSHPDYADQFSEQATAVATTLAGMDLSCIPRGEDSDLVHPRLGQGRSTLRSSTPSNAFPKPYMQLNLGRT